MVQVAGIDALGGIAHVEILLPLLARDALQLRDADLLGRARVDRRLEHDDGAGLEVGAEAAAGAHEGAEIRQPGVVHRGGHGHDHHVCGAQRGRVVGVAQAAGGLHLGGAHLARGVGARAVGLDLLPGDVEPDGVEGGAELHGEGQAHVAQPDDPDGVAHSLFPCAGPHIVSPRRRPPCKLP